MVEPVEEHVCLALPWPITLITQKKREGARP
jgi:hypothetical protein